MLCKKCNVEKDVTQFHMKAPNGKRDSTCGACMNQARRQKRKAAKKVRDIRKCGRASCVNPRNGNLTREDYTIVKTPHIRLDGTFNELETRCKECRRPGARAAYRQAKLEAKMKPQELALSKKAVERLKLKKLKAFKVDWEEFQGWQWDVRRANGVLRSTL